MKMIIKKTCFVYIIIITTSIVNCIIPSECNFLQIPAQCTCGLPTINEMDPSISCTGLTAVPNITVTGGYNGSINEFNLAKNNIEILPDNAFYGLRIRKIFLNGNKLNNVSDTAFVGQENYLTELKISGDNSSEISPPYNSIKNLTNLQTLHISHFKYTDEGTFWFPNLIELQLEWMQINFIKADFFNLPNLKTLRLINNLFTSLPILHHTLVNLEHIAITGNHITEIPFYYFQKNTKVKFFDVSQNAISLLEEDCFHGVTNVLEKLVLNQNPLSTVDKLERIKNLTALKELRLEHVGLREIPPNPVFLQNKNQLKFIYLNGNQLRNLTGDIFSGTGYRILKMDLSNNQLDSLSNDFFINLGLLEDLALEDQTSVGNFILPSFSSLTSLKKLNLELTRLDTDQAWTEIQHLQNLVALNLDSTGLRHIKEFVFRNFTKLYELSLQDNSISSLTQEMLVGMKHSLEYLYLANNQITTMGECVFHNFSRSLHISLTNNPLHCDCKLAWLKNSITDAHIRFVTQREQCKTPAKNANETFMNVPITDFVCDLHRVLPDCPDYYQPSTTSQPLLSTSLNTPTIIPDIQVQVSVTAKNLDSITISFSATPLEYVKQFVIEHTNLKTLEMRSEMLQHTATTYKMLGLTSDTRYEVCVRAKKINNHFKSECYQVKTLVDPDATTMTSPVATAQKDDTGIIIGAVIGGIVLLCLLGAIIYLVLFKKNKDITTSPAVKAVKRANLPTIGYDSKRFNKKKRPINYDNQTNENIQVSVISGGPSNDQPNLGRISAGSYQYLDKDHKSQTNTKPVSGEYTNSNEIRPLPSTPRKHHSYQNEGFQRSPTSDTEPHTYSEIGLV